MVIDAPKQKWIFFLQKLMPTRLGTLWLGLKDFMIYSIQLRFYKSLQLIKIALCNLDKDMTIWQCFFFFYFFGTDQIRVMSSRTWHFWQSFFLISWWTKKNLAFLIFSYRFSKLQLFALIGISNFSNVLIRLSFRFEIKFEDFVMKTLKKKIKFCDFRSQKIMIFYQSQLNFWKTYFKHSVLTQ